MSLELLTEHRLQFLSLRGGCKGSSDSTPVKMPQCWKSHVAAHMPGDILTETEFPSEPMERIEQREIRKQQLDSRFLGYWVRAARNNTLPDKLAAHKTRDNLAM